MTKLALKIVVSDYDFNFKFKICKILRIFYFILFYFFIFSTVKPNIRNPFSLVFFSLSPVFSRFKTIDTSGFRGLTCRMQNRILPKMEKFLLFLYFQVIWFYEAKIKGMFDSCF